MKKDEFITNSEAETISLGLKFADCLAFGNVVCFTGDLGAGKTEFIKGICSKYNVTEFVTSPTFTIVNKYDGVIDNHYFDIFHLDLYRIKNPSELTEIGFDEFMDDSDSIKLIEWAEKAGSKLEKIDYHIYIHIIDDDENQRKIEIINYKDYENN